MAAAWVLAGLLGGAQAVAGSNHAQATGGPCQGVAPLYAPPEAHAPPRPGGGLLGTGGILGMLAELPVAFVPSGDACLGPVPVYRVIEVPAVPAQPTTHAMARAMAPHLARFSAHTGLEACARMCTTPSGTIVAQVVTLRAHVVCAAPESTCPSGSVATPETIHSHPPRTLFVANAVDAVGWDEPGIVGVLTWAGDPDLVSPQDRLAAPVWVVGGNGRLVWLDHPDGQEVERP